MKQGRTVLILGGGVAGLASAFAHLEAGFEVTLVEARRRLGGRAWSWRDGQREERDNGPHILLGCYDSFRWLLGKLGVEDSFHRARVLKLAWLERGGRLHRLDPPRLPSPLHLWAGMLRIQGWDFASRLGLCFSALLPFLPLPPPDLDLESWRRRKGVSQAAWDFLLRPLCLAVMNESPERAEARLFLRTLRTAFRGRASGSALWLPLKPWGRILDAPARQSLAEAGCRLLLGRRVRGLEPGRPPKVRLADGSLLEGHGRLVLALPWGMMGRLDPEEGFSRRAASLTSTPLLTVHLKLPPSLLPFGDPVLGLVGGDPFHFLVRTPGPWGRALPGAPLALLAGGARSLDGLPRGRIVDLALRELAAFLGHPGPWPGGVRKSALVLREAHATFGPHPGVGALRPRPGPTALPGLWLAGDWTDTGLPSTLEGAARSGRLPVLEDRHG